MRNKQTIIHHTLTNRKTEKEESVRRRENNETERKRESGVIKYRVFQVWQQMTSTMTE